MQIQEYHFWFIQIDTKVFSDDLIIYPDKIFSSWWREEWHLLKINDIEDMFFYKPEILIVWKWAYGEMKISLNLIDKLKKENIDLVKENTFEAVKSYNQLSSKKKVVAALHLTC